MADVKKDIMCLKEKKKGEGNIFDTKVIFIILAFLSVDRFSQEP